jgi:hypothetical protein
VVGRSGLRLQVVADPAQLGGTPSGELPHPDAADRGTRDGAAR